RARSGVPRQVLIQQFCNEITVGVDLDERRKGNSAAQRKEGGQADVGDGVGPLQSVKILCGQKPGPALAERANLLEEGRTNRRVSGDAPIDPLLLLGLPLVVVKPADT